MLLGIRILRDRKLKTIYLDQEHYLDRILTDFSFSHSKYKKKIISINGYENLRATLETDEKFDVKTYQKIIGSLMYAMTMTRPEISFVLECLARHMSNPAIHHYHAAKEVMRYLRSTIQQKLTFRPGESVDNNHFVLYTDADWAGDRTSRKSVSGGVGILYGGPFCWTSKKQRTVTRSSCESEYISQSANAM